jgi:hypothetical protein
MRNQHCRLPILCDSFETKIYMNLEIDCHSSFNPEDMGSIYLQNDNITAHIHAV